MSDIVVLDVLIGERRIGTLTRLPGDHTLFAFASDYVEDPGRPTLGLAFKDEFGGLIADSEPRRRRLPPFFSNLLPEGPMGDYLAARAGVKPEQEFALIRALGRDLPGALRLLPADGREIAGAEPAAPRPRARRGDGGALHFSLAGVQLKFSAVKKKQRGWTIRMDGTGGSWIVKLPSTIYPDVPENEFAMMELARRVGIEVPRTKLVPIDEISGLPDGITAAGANAFAIERFDRTEDGGRVHIEDFAQVFGIYPEAKYKEKNYRSIARVLWTEDGRDAIEEFVRRLAFTVLIGNGDMHLKNWSLIYPDGRNAKLSPAYDFVSTVGYIKGDRLALNVTDSKAFAAVTLPEFERFAAKARLPEKLVLDTARETVARFREAWRDPPPMPDFVRRALDAHLATLPLL
ncbi:MAG TPA: type II toxin-antitoxin system HipA family toxin [Rhizomicrobium sp.]|nr:type II toxin-antitoxin system HipA family toxin [Rhizomicrobium sp.]